MSAHSEGFDVPHTTQTRHLPVPLATASEAASGQQPQGPCPSEILKQLRDAVGGPNFDHWLSRRSRFDVQHDTLKIFVPNPFIANWLLKRFRTSFNKAASELLGPSARFDLIVDETLQAEASGQASVTVLPSSRTSPILAVSPQNVTPIAAPRQVTAGLDGIQPLAVRPMNRRRFSTFS
ncbi:MAG: DnaA N-terminal domain-containing protein [Planctomycetaceae bacterium]